jgi:hypothetical protein
LTMQVCGSQIGQPAWKFSPSNSQSELEHVLKGYWPVGVRGSIL